MAQIPGVFNASQYFGNTSPTKGQQNSFWDQQTGNVNQSSVAFQGPFDGNSTAAVDSSMSDYQDDFDNWEAWPPQEEQFVGSHPGSHNNDYYGHQENSLHSYNSVNTATPNNSSGFHQPQLQVSHNSFYYQEDLSEGSSTAESSPRVEPEMDVWVEEEVEQPSNPWLSNPSSFPGLQQTVTAPSPNRNQQHDPLFSTAQSVGRSYASVCGVASEPSQSPVLQGGEESSEYPYQQGYVERGDSWSREPEIGSWSPVFSHGNDTPSNANQVVPGPPGSLVEEAMGTNSSQTFQHGVESDTHYNHGVPPPLPQAELFGSTESQEDNMPTGPHAQTNQSFGRPPSSYYQQGPYPSSQAGQSKDPGGNDADKVKGAPYAKMVQQPFEGSSASFFDDVPPQTPQADLSVEQRGDAAQTQSVPHVQMPQPFGGSSAVYHQEVSHPTSQADTSVENRGKETDMQTAPQVQVFQPYGGSSAGFFDEVPYQTSQADLFVDSRGKETHMQTASGAQMVQPFGGSPAGHHHEVPHPTSQALQSVDQRGEVARTQSAPQVQMPQAFGGSSLSYFDDVPPPSSQADLFVDNRGKETDMQTAPQAQMPQAFGGSSPSFFDEVPPPSSQVDLSADNRGKETDMQTAPHTYMVQPYGGSSAGNHQEVPHPTSQAGLSVDKKEWVADAQSAPHVQMPQPFGGATASFFDEVPRPSSQAELSVESVDKKEQVADVPIALHVQMPQPFGGASASFFDEVPRPSSQAELSVDKKEQVADVQTAPHVQMPQPFGGLSAGYHQDVSHSTSQAGLSVDQRGEVAKTHSAPPAQMPQPFGEPPASFYNKDPHATLQADLSVDKRNEAAEKQTAPRVQMFQPGGGASPGNHQEVHDPSRQALLGDGRQKEPQMENAPQLFQPGGGFPSSSTGGIFAEDSSQDAYGKRQEGVANLFQPQVTTASFPAEYAAGDGRLESAEERPPQLFQPSLHQVAGPLQSQSHFHQDDAPTPYPQADVLHVGNGSNPSQQNHFDPYPYGSTSSSSVPPAVAETPVLAEMPKNPSEGLQPYGTPQADLPQSGMMTPEEALTPNKPGSPVHVAFLQKQLAGKEPAASPRTSLWMNGAALTAPCMLAPATVITAESTDVRGAEQAPGADKKGSDASNQPEERGGLQNSSRLVSTPVRVPTGQTQETTAGPVALAADPVHHSVPSPLPPVGNVPVSQPQPVSSSNVANLHQENVLPLSKESINQVPRTGKLPLMEQASVLSESSVYASPPAAPPIPGAGYMQQNAISQPQPREDQQVVEPRQSVPVMDEHTGKLPFVAQASVQPQSSESQTVHASPSAAPPIPGAGYVQQVPISQAQPRQDQQVAEPQQSVLVTDEHTGKLPFVAQTSVPPQRSVSQSVYASPLAAPPIPGAGYMQQNAISQPQPSQDQQAVDPRQSGFSVMDEHAGKLPFVAQASVQPQSTVSQPVYAPPSAAPPMSGAGYLQQTQPSQSQQIVEPQQSVPVTEENTQPRQRIDSPSRQAQSKPEAVKSLASILQGGGTRQKKKAPVVTSTPSSQTDAEISQGVSAPQEMAPPPNTELHHSSYEHETELPSNSAQGTESFEQAQHPAENDPHTQEYPRQREDSYYEKDRRENDWRESDRDDYDRRDYDGRGYDRREYDNNRRDYDGRGYGGRREDSRDYDRRDYDKREHDRRDYEGRDHDRREYDRREYDGREYDRRDYNSRREYDGREYDRRDFDRRDYDRRVSYDNRNPYESTSSPRQGRKDYYGRRSSREDMYRYRSPEPSGNYYSHHSGRSTPSSGRNSPAAYNYVQPSYPPSNQYGYPGYAEQTPSYAENQDLYHYMLMLYQYYPKQYEQYIAQHSFYGSEQQGYHAGYSPYQQQEARVVEAEPQRLTPLMFRTQHPIVRFSGGRLISLMPSREEGEHPRCVVASVQMVFSVTELDYINAFPGPLTRYSSRTEVISYCETRSGDAGSGEGVVKSLLWRVLANLVKHNGAFVASDLAELIMENWRGSNKTEENELHSAHGGLPPLSDTETRGHLQVYREMLLAGATKDALEYLMKYQMWGHTLILASKMDKKVHNDVMNRFLRTMGDFDPIRTVYDHMSGRQPVSVMTPDDWQRHLAAMVANPSRQNFESNKKNMICLGDTLMANEQVCAAHLCYLLGGVGFGFPNESETKVVLLGIDHKKVNLTGKHIPLDNLQMMEVLEYATSLSNEEYYIPSLQTYKYLHAMKLSEAGFSDEALQYADSIGHVLIRHPHHFNGTLVKNVKELADRLNPGTPDTTELTEMLDKLLQAKDSSQISSSVSESESSAEEPLAESSASFFSGYDPATNMPKQQEQHMEIQPQSSLPELPPSVPLTSQDSVPDMRQDSWATSMDMQVTQPDAGQQNPPTYEPQVSWGELPPAKEPVAQSPYFIPQAIPEQFPGQIASAQPVMEEQASFNRQPTWDDSYQSSWLNGASAEEPKIAEATPPKEPEPEKKLESKPDKSDKKKKKKKEKASSQGGWLSGLSGGLSGMIAKVIPRGPNEMKLPDDNKKSIYYDEDLKKWVDTEEDEQEKVPPPPPPSDMQLRGAMPPPQMHTNDMQLGAQMPSPTAMQVGSGMLSSHIGMQAGMAGGGMVSHGSGLAVPGVATVGEVTQQANTSGPAGHARSHRTPSPFSRKALGGSRLAKTKRYVDVLNPTGKGTSGMAVPSNLLPMMPSPSSEFTGSFFVPSPVTGSSGESTYDQQVDQPAIGNPSSRPSSRTDDDDGGGQQSQHSRSSSASLTSAEVRSYMMPQDPDPPPQESSAPPPPMFYNPMAFTQPKTPASSRKSRYPDIRK